MLLPKSKLKSMEVLSPKASVKLVISHDEFILINNVLKEYKKMKEEIKNLVCPLDLACIAKVSDVIYKSYRIAWNVKNTESKNPKVERSKNERIMLLSKCTVHDSKKSKFIKQQVASRWSSRLLSKIP